jgi:hypothetical protein
MITTTEADFLKARTQFEWMCQFVQQAGWTTHQGDGDVPAANGTLSSQAIFYSWMPVSSISSRRGH